MSSASSKTVRGRADFYYTLVWTKKQGWRLNRSSEYEGTMRWSGPTGWTRNGAWFATPEEATRDVASDIASSLIQSVLDKRTQ